jgi:hypothetical protein
MTQDFWIVGVLRDIGQYADDRALNRLKIAIKYASEEFLNDIRDQHVEEVSRLPRKTIEQKGDGEIVVRFKKDHIE